MQYVKDRNGRDWEIKITVNTLKRIKAFCNFDLINLIAVDEKTGEPNVTLLEELANDPILLVDVLYATCKPQADLNNITDEQFGELFAGDEIENAISVLLEEIINFFPDAKKKLWSKVNQASKITAKKHKTALMEELDKIQVEDLVLQFEKSIESSMNMPDIAE